MDLKSKTEATKNIIQEHLDENQKVIDDFKTEGLEKSRIEIKNFSFDVSKLRTEIEKLNKTHEEVHQSWKNFAFKTTIASILFIIFFIAVAFFFVVRNFKLLKH